MADYISYIRNMVGHELVMMAAACAVVEDGEGRILLQKRSEGLWSSLGERDCCSRMRIRRIRR